MNTDFRTKLSQAAEIKKIKEEAFYSTVYQGLYDNCMEEDRQILALAVAGIGLLVTVFYTKLSTSIAFWLWITGIFLFLIDIILIFSTFHHNQKLLHAWLKEDPIVTKSSKRSEMLKMRITKKGVKLLPWLTPLARIFFILGVLATLSLACYEGKLRLIEKEKYRMTEEKKNSLDIFIDTDPNKDSKISKK